MWIALRDLESRWWSKSDKIYADSLKLISREMVSDITEENAVELIDLTSSPIVNEFDVFSQPSTSKRLDEEEQHKIWEESKLVAEGMLAQQAKKKQAKKEQHQIWKESKLVAEQIRKGSELVAQQAREKRKRKLQEAQNQKTTGNEQYARVAPVSSILNNKLGYSLPDLVCCSLTTTGAPTFLVGDPIQTAAQAGTSFDRNTIFELEAETAKVAEQMLAQQAMERQARKQEKEQQARERRKQEKEKRSKEKRQQLLTE